MGLQNNHKYNDISTTTPGPLFSQRQYNKSQPNATYLTTRKQPNITHFPLHIVTVSSLHLKSRSTHHQIPEQSQNFFKIYQLSYIKYPSGAENYTKYKKLNPKFHNVVSELALSTL